MQTPSSPDVPAVESRLAASLERVNLRVDPSQRRSLARYVALLAQWNRAYNLTAVRDPFAMIDRHVLDSLTALDFLVGTRLLDVGTGAGLPGLVLAIVRPDVRCTLLDPVRKKTRFCAHAAMTLGLDNVEVASERLATHRPQRPYTTVISRATLSIAELVAGARPLLDARGRIVAMKGDAAPGGASRARRTRPRRDRDSSRTGCSRRSVARPDPRAHRPCGSRPWRCRAGECNNPVAFDAHRAQFASALFCRIGENHWHA